MKIGGTFIADTFAEGFRMRYARIVITALDEHWLDAALRELTGYASSVIGCDAEAGIERRLGAIETPDARPGASVLLFGFSEERLARAVPDRTGQCLMTCLTTAAYDGLPGAARRIPLGKHVRFFGDGFQKSKVIAGRRYWRIPVMDGEFLVEDTAGVEKGVAGGNIIIEGEDLEATLTAARRATDTLLEVPGAITPFPGGAVRSGSKVGSRYPGLVGSTNDAFCPTLRSRVETRLHEGAHSACEIVINGISEDVVGGAMAIAIRSAAGDGVVAISAGNYGGRLGKFHFPLREVLA